MYIYNICCCIILITRCQRNNIDKVHTAQLHIHIYRALGQSAACVHGDFEHGLWIVKIPRSSYCYYFLFIFAHITSFFTYQSLLFLGKGNVSARTRWHMQLHELWPRWCFCFIFFYFSNDTKTNESFTAHGCCQFDLNLVLRHPPYKLFAALNCEDLQAMKIQ